MDLPSLRDQLCRDDRFRVELDDGLLRLLGVEDRMTRTTAASEMRKGVLIAIEALKRAMSGDRQSGID